MFQHITNDNGTMKKNVEIKFHSNETIEQHCMQIWIEIQLNWSQIHWNWIQIQLKRNGIQIVEKDIENLQKNSIICNYNIGKKKGGSKNHLSIPFRENSKPKIIQDPILVYAIKTILIITLSKLKLPQHFK